LRTTPRITPEAQACNAGRSRRFAPILALELPEMLSTPWVYWLVLAVVVAAVVALRHWHGLERARQGRHLELARTVAAQSLGAVDREAALKPIAAALPGLLDATNAQILLVDSTEQQMVYFVGAKGRPRGSVSMSTISGPVTCFRAKETTEVADAKNCPFISNEWVAKRKLKSALYVPILNGDACIGVIEVEDRKRKRGFDESQRAFAEHLAKIAELSLRLYDQRTMTEQLHRSEKLASVSELASAMAAELSEPFEEAQRLREAAGVASTEPLRQVVAQVTKAQVALDRLVRFAIPSATAQADVDLNDLVRRIAEEYEKTDDRQGTIRLSLSDRRPQVRADPAHLEQLVQILFRHARHFVRRLEGHSLQTHTAVRDTMAIVSIAPLASADHPVRRRLAQLPDSARNVALGFSVCQALVERAGGSLQMDPASSLGFRIDLEYPLARRITEPASPDGITLRRTSQGIRSGPITALVVVPDPKVRQLIMHQLAEQSIRAIPVNGIEEAKSACNRLPFDWVFCELRLGNGSGIELYESVRRGIEMFIFIADDAATSANPGAFRAPDKTVLRKPVRTEAVEALLEELQGGPVLDDA
jgi:GAF domain-containing protein/CheY-like chemotaxis protein